MTVLHLLADGSHFAGDVLFSGCFEPRFKLSRHSSLSQLLGVLEESKYSDPTAISADNTQIVVMALPIGKVYGAVLQIKAILPTAVCISILDPDEGNKETKLYDWDCLFIQRPLNEFALKSIVAAALRQAKLLVSLATVAQFDETIGLFNHRYFMSHLVDGLALVRRHQEQFACVVFSVQYYEMLLDTYGYEFIHALYKYLAGIIQDHIRQEDVMARVGDEEIGLLLFKSDEQGAKSLTQRIMKTVAKKPFQFKTEEEHIALSAGIFGFPAVAMPGADADMVIRYARHALHQAKKQPEDKEGIVIFSQMYPLE